MVGAHWSGLSADVRAGLLERVNLRVGAVGNGRNRQVALGLNVVRAMLCERSCWTIIIHPERR